MTETKQRRHRKPHDIFFTAAALDEGDLIFECIQVIPPDPKSVTEPELFEMASQNFVQKHGLSPNKIDGPFFRRKGTVQPVKSEEKKRKLSLQVDLDKVDYTKELRSAEYNGWQVIARYIANPTECVSNYVSEQGKVVSVRFKMPLTGAPTKKKSIPSSKFVLESDLDNIKPYD